MQLLKLSRAWEGYPTCCVTTLPLAVEALAPWGKVHVIGECNRHHPIRAMGVLLRVIKVAWSERPDVVLTTGSLPLALFCLAAKCLGAKTIWIDSVTNVEKLSMSGRLMRHFADLLLTQWPHLQKKYRHVEYAGAIV